MKAFVEKLLNLDENQKYLIITCGEEVHFAYNRVGFVISLNFYSSYQSIDYYMDILD